MYNVLKKIYLKMKSYKTTVFGLLAGFLYAFCSGAMDCVFDNQIDTQCLLHLAFAAAITTGLAFAKDFNVTGGKVKMIALFCLLSFSANSQSVTEDNQRFHNVYLPAADPKGSICVNYEGTIGSDTTKMLRDTLIRIVSDETPDAQTVTSLAATNTTKGIYIAQGDTNDFGGFSYNKERGVVSLFGKKDGSSIYRLDITPDGVNFSDSSGSNFSAASKSGSYTPDTSNNLLYVTSTVFDANYTVTDSIIEVYGLISGVSSDSTTECVAMLSLPTGYTSTINGLNGICSVYSPAQRVEGNGICIASATKVELIFYTSRQARADIYYRYSYRWK